MSYGVTENGFIRKTYDQTITEMKEEAKTLFGEDINLNDNSPLGKIFKVAANQISDAWKDSELNYSSGYVLTASAQALDYAVADGGVSRKPASKSIGEQLRITGDEGTIIPITFTGQTVAEVKFNTTNETEILIPAAGFIDLPYKADVAGSSGNVAIGTIIEIVNPVSGIDSISNIDAAQGGSDKETDTELRIRYFETISLGSGSSTNAIRSAVLQNTDVTACKVLENKTMDDPDAQGLPPKSTQTIVVGGNNADIADSLLNFVAGGMETFGAITVVVQDDSGNDQSIDFSRGTQVETYITVDNLETSVNYPTDGDEQIKAALQLYYSSLTLENDVIYNKIISRVDSINGVVNFELFMDTTASPTATDDITITATEVAVIQDTNVVINHV